MIIAVDFDGTIVEHNFPDIGKPNIALINKLLWLKNIGHKIVLWTCREGIMLEDAIQYCKIYGLIFDGVNENIRDVPYSNFSRKIYADIYIDDRAITPEDFLEREMK